MLGQALLCGSLCSKQAYSPVVILLGLWCCANVLSTLKLYVSSAGIGALREHLCGPAGSGLLFPQRLWNGAWKAHGFVNATTLLIAHTVCVCWLQVLALYESTFVGLQALGSHFPKGSAELQAAEQALVAVLSKLVTELKGVYGDDMLYQVCAALLLLVRPCVGWGFAALVRGGGVCAAAARAGGDFVRLWCIDAGCACAWQREHACGAV